MIKLKSLLVKENVGKIEVPQEPGTVPIPPNHLRLYHYTYTDPTILKKEGLKLSRAKGTTYGEPNFVWASLQQPSDTKIYVEFSMPIDDPRFSRMGAKPDPTWGVEFYKGKGNDFTILGDVSPSEFIAVHEPWHHHYRYMIENGLVDGVLKGEYDYIDDKFPNEKKALETIKRNFSISDISEQRDDFNEVNKYEIEDLNNKEEIIQYLQVRGKSPEIINLGGDEYIIWEDYIIDPEFPRLEKKRDWINDTQAWRLVGKLIYMMEERFNKQFWEHPQTLYHATPLENVDSIRKDGLQMIHKSRGLANKHIRAAVFTSTEPDWATFSYGPVQVVINTDAMKKDGFMPFVTKEPNHTESDVVNFIARKIGDWEEDKDYTGSYGEGTTEDTVVVYDDIPPKYLEIEEPK
jgi:hypothetical protein